MELKHVGIILVVIGTILLAFSLKIIHGYDTKHPVMKESHKIAKESGYVWPSETYINKWLFWAGLACVALGSLLQW